MFLLFTTGSIICLGGPRRRNANCFNLIFSGHCASSETISNCSNHCWNELFVRLWSSPENSGIGGRCNWAILFQVCAYCRGVSLFNCSPRASESGDGIASGHLTRGGGLLWSPAVSVLPLSRLTQQHFFRTTLET